MTDKFRTPDDHMEEDYTAKIVSPIPEWATWYGPDKDNPECATVVERVGWGDDNFTPCYRVREYQDISGYWKPDSRGRWRVLEVWGIVAPDICTAAAIGIEKIAHCPDNEFMATEIE